jgi:uncharacterized protein (TIGR02284 family)
MKTNEKIAEVLNDLIQINNDRVVGYQKASEETDVQDADLRTLFNDMASESRRYSNELSKYVTRSTMDNPAEGTTMKGKIYRVWMDLKATFSGHTRKEVLSSCEYGEDAAQKAYDQALTSDAEIPADLRKVIMNQKTSLRKSHDKIKSMRDAQPAS